MAMQGEESGPLDAPVYWLNVYEKGIRVRWDGRIRPEDLERLVKAILQAAWKHRHNRASQWGRWDDGTEEFSYRFDGRGGVIVAAADSFTPLAAQIIEGIRAVAPGKVRVEGEGAA